MTITLSACVGGSKPVGLSPNVDLASQGALPVPTQQDLLANNRPYFIGPFDQLKIDVFGVEELSDIELQVDSSGRLSFPLIGVVEAAGLTPGELSGSIEQKLRGRFIREPSVTVNLDGASNQLVTVDGQVEDPGLYPVVGKMTLIRAVATAGGAAEFAKLTDVVVFRTVNGQKMAGLYNLDAIRRGNYEDPEIFANDIVIVGDSKSRRLFRDFIQASPLLTTPLLILFR